MSRRTVAFVLGVFGIAAPQVASEPPQGWGAWVLLVAGAMVGGLIATGLLSSLLEGPETGWWSFTLPGRDRVRSVVLPIVVLAIAIVVGVSAASGVRAVRTAMRGCTTPVEVPVVASPATVETASALAQAFEISTARSRRDCPGASLSVYAADSAMVQTALAHRWNLPAPESPQAVDYLRDLGPRPEIWMPDSTLDVDQLTATIARAGAVSPLRTPATVYGSSPLVIAVPAGAGAGPAPGDWRAALEAYERDSFDVVRPDPIASTSGRLWLAAIYAGLKWDSEGRKVARDIEVQLAAGRDNAGYPVGAEAALLQKYQSTKCDPVPRTALILPEQFVAHPQFADAAVRADLGCAAEPRRLVSVSPADTPVLNHPFVRLSWDVEHEGPAARTAAEFGRWLSTDEGERAVRATGLHAGSSRPARLHSPKPTATELDPLLYRAVTQAMAQYQEVARPVALQLAVDTSGSMATRSDLAAAVLNDTADRLSDSDLLGLLSFGGAANGVRELVPIARVEAPSRSVPSPGGTTRQVTSTLNTREAVRDELARLRPAGGTPLLRAIDRAVSTLLALPPATGRERGAAGASASSTPTPIRAVAVLTDGQDTAGGPNSIEVVADRADRGGVRVFVVTVGSADCTTALLRTITVRSGGGCLVARNGAEAGATALTSAIWGAKGD